MDSLDAGEMSLTFKGKNAMVRVRVRSSTKKHGEEELTLEVFVAGAGGMTAGQIFDAACKRAVAIIERFPPDA